jgi:hypothetical protein
MWAVHFRNRDPLLKNTEYGSGNKDAIFTYGPTRLTVASTDTSGQNADLGLFNVPKLRAEPNLLIQGLGSTQRITCDVTDELISNYFGQGVTKPMKQTTQPSIWLVAQASSGNSARVRAGSRLGSVQVQLNRPVEFSQVSSWAGSIE